MLFEKKPLSDHIEIAAFPAAKSKGDLVKFGSIIGFSDYDTAAGAPGSVDIGKPAAVFQAALAGLTGDTPPAVGVDVYIKPSGALTTNESDTVSQVTTINFLIGTIVRVGSDTVDFVRI
jgi:predicted RecA/RadA family phage recombinase